MPLRRVKGDYQQPQSISGGRAREGGDTVSQDAIWLTQWQSRLGYLDYEAAAALAISVAAFRRQRSGRSRVSPQTALLALYVSLHRADFLDIAELAQKLAMIQGGRRRNGRLA